MTTEYYETLHDLNVRLKQLRDQHNTTTHRVTHFFHHSAKGWAITWKIVPRKCNKPLDHN